MNLWNRIKEWARNVWSWVKSLFSSWDTYSEAVSNDETNDTWKQTLNQQIASWTINKPTTNINNINQTAIWDSGFNLVQEKTDDTTTSIDTNTIYKSVPTQEQDAEEETFLSKLGNFFSWINKDIQEIKEDVDSGINKFMRNRAVNRLVNKEYKRQEQLYAVWYNPNNRNVYYLDFNKDLWSREWSKARFEELYSEAIQKMSETWDVWTAYNDFYNQAKTEWLFGIRADDFYSWGKRRDNMYTQSELDQLSKNWKTIEWKYSDITFDEFIDFVNVYNENMATQQELWMVVQANTPNYEELELTAWLAEDWMAKERTIALKNIDEFLYPMSVINPNAASQARITYSTSVLWQELPRRYNHVASIYNAEQEVLSRDKSTWSEHDKSILRDAEIARQLDKQFAENVNDLFRQILLYWTNKNWDIVDTPDVFENGESLNDVLTKWMREIVWETRWRWWGDQHQSHIDIVSAFANEALYEYNKDKWWALKQWWNWFEHFLEPLWTNLWEFGQRVWGIGMDINRISSMGLINNALNKSYMDQDATVFRLLETDDSNIKRTIKKYYLEALEYTPEVLWNLAPDIALYALTWWATWATIVRHVKDISTATKVVRAAEWASFLNKVKFITWIRRWVEAVKELWVPLSKYEEIINAAKNVKNASRFYQRIKTWAQLVDRATTELVLWQFMDAQWSAYDTEAYSQASFLMSVIWSSIFDVLPSVSRLFTGRWIIWLLSWADNIWSLARYIDSSPEAAKNIAAALRKWTWEIWINELEAFVKDFWVIEEAARQAYNSLTTTEKQTIWQFTKELGYRYINQAFGANSTIGKTVRQILENKNTNVADIVKYVGRIPGEVSVGPFVSTIKFKNWTRANVYTVGEKYDAVLDSVLDWGFSTKVQKWFAQADIDSLSKISKYSDVEKNKAKWFNSIATDDGWTTYYLNEAWLKHFWLKAESITLESLWVALKEVENTREALQKIKWVNWVKISDTTVDRIANAWAYDEITQKVQEVLWC